MKHLTQSEYCVFETFTVEDGDVLEAMGKLLHKIKTKFDEKKYKGIVWQVPPFVKRASTRWSASARLKFTNEV